MLEVPPELQQLLYAVENEAQLAQDILDGLDEFDVIDFNVDEKFEDIAELLSGLSIPFTSCDP